MSCLKLVSIKIRQTLVFWKLFRDKEKLNTKKSNLQNDADDWNKLIVWDTIKYISKLFDCKFILKSNLDIKIVFFICTIFC